MLYFAFASNLDPDQMKERCPGHRVVGLAVLRDHRLSFPRYTERWDGGAASVQLAHGDAVWGIVYDLDLPDLDRLDGYEGYRGPGDQHNTYDREAVWVELTRPADGSVPRRVRASIYLARPANPTPPSRRYLDAILKGARHWGLPDEYIAKLVRIPAGGEGDAPAAGA